MIEIPNTLAPLFIQALRDAVVYNKQLLLSQTLKNREDYEQYYLDVTQFFAEMKAEYKKIESEIGIPLADLV